ncbi:Protein M3 [Pleurotus ostreatus]|uniref:Protein M3 n=1 Tax=Pleurotus ostreatus TaxID=5322 RepID=A0A8H7DL48_PLEOS|nr:Protein M3 [Pleurotus ostreatus]KAF7419569.1 Protein M3 [Pleurotus ostreatus]
MLSVGTLIWISLRPLIRLVICGGCGFAITKADIFPPIAARGAGQIMLNIALPCLMFSKIVPAFTSENIGALGPLVLVAVLYEAIGIVIAWIIKQVYWTPHRFRYGILVAGGWGNYGDIPTSVLMSITGAAPFNGSSDQTLSVAYVSAFILVFMVTLFPCGGHSWVAKDYVGPEVEDEEVKEVLRRKHRKWASAILHPLAKFSPGLSLSRAPSCEEGASNVNEKIQEPCTTTLEAPTVCGARSKKHVSFFEDATTVVTEPIKSAVSSPGPSRLTSPAPTVVANFESAEGGQPTSAADTHSITRYRRRNIVYAKLVAVLRTLCTPASIAIIIAFPIAVVPQLKALFVDVPGTHIPPAPDGQPPLAFIIDTATFIGAASVPLGLICLGSALARLKIPKNQWRTLPIGAIAWLAIGKLIVMPVLGVLICQGLVSAGVIREEDKVLRFVCIFFSCLPTATTQVFLTQVYSGTGSAEHLSAFLIPQYIIMFLSITALTAYTLQMLF